MKTEIVQAGNTQVQFSEVADEILSALLRQISWTNNLTIQTLSMSEILKLSPAVRQIVPDANFMRRVNLMWKNKYEEEKV